MKKIIILLFYVSVFQLSFAVESITIDGKTYTVDTLANFKVGPGTQYTSLRLKSNSRLDVYFLKVDASNPYITFKTVLGRDSIYTGEQPSAMAKRKTKEGAMYFAGTNGDFYNTGGYVGLPIGCTMIDGQLATPPAGSWKSITFDEQKVPGIGVLTYTTKVKKGTETWTVNRVNHLRDANQLVLFNQHNGKGTRANAFGTEVLLQLVDGANWGVNKTLKAKVIKIEMNKGNMAIPAGHAVLSGHGTAQTLLNTLVLNDEINIELNMLLDGVASSFSNIVGGESRAPMLKNGVVEQSDIWNELHPRTGIGYSQDKKTIIYCVIDGRGLSAGVTTKQLAQIIQSAGAYTAFNMDGGGSSCMYVKEFGPMNATSDGSERAVANGIFAVSTAPTDLIITDIKSYETTIKLPKFGVFKPKFIGYNQYGVLINKDLQGVTLTCDSELGYINDQGQLVASGTKNGLLYASYNGYQTKVNISIVDEAQIAIRLDSVLIDAKTEYPIEVQSVIGLNTMQVLASALTWTIQNPQICSVQNGVLKGLTNGTTLVIGNLGSFKDTIKVIVQIPEFSRHIQDNFSNPSSWTITPPLTTWNTVLASDNLPSGWNHGIAVRYIYKSARLPSIKLSKLMPLYSIPDSIKLVLNTGNVDVSNLYIGMRGNNQTINVSVTTANIQKNKEVELNFPISQFVNNKNDLISYPVWFDYINLYINTGTQVQDVTYNIYLKEIVLIYKNISLGLHNTKASLNFQVFPNPLVNDDLTIISNENDSNPLLVSIFNLNGQLLENKTLSSNTSKEIHFSFAKYKSGSYILKLNQGNKKDTVKIFKN